MTGPSARILSLLSLLQVRREWAGDELAGRLDVSPRTVRRDVDRLRDLGYRIAAVRGPAGGYRLAAGSELPPLLFDDDQAVAVALALAVAPASGAGIAESAARALATVRQVMPARLRARMDGIEVVPTSGPTTVDPDVLVAVSEAVRDHHVLRFGYAPAWPPGASDDRPPRRVDPHAVVARHGRWYLLAWDTEAADWRTYRVDRIDPRMPTRASFTPRDVPGGDAAAFVAARFRGSGVPDGAGSVDSGWPCVGTVELEASAATIAPYLEPDAVLDDLGPDRCRVTIGAWSWGALAARAAGFDVEFVVVDPEPLRSAARSVGERLRLAGHAS